MVQNRYMVHLYTHNGCYYIALRQLDQHLVVEKCMHTKNMFSFHMWSIFMNLGTNSVRVFFFTPKDAIDLLQGHYIVSVARDSMKTSQRAGIEAVAVSNIKFVAFRNPSTVCRNNVVNKCF